MSGLIPIFMKPDIADPIQFDAVIGTPEAGAVTAEADDEDDATLVSKASKQGPLPIRRTFPLRPRGLQQAGHSCPERFSPPARSPRASSTILRS